MEPAEGSIWRGRRPHRSHCREGLRTRGSAPTKQSLRPSGSFVYSYESPGHTQALARPRIHLALDQVTRAVGPLHRVRALGGTSI